MEFKQVWKRRRSTRNFQSRQIAGAELDAILLAGCSAPVGSNFYRDVHLTMVQDKETLMELSAALRRRMGDRTALEKITGEIEGEKSAPASAPFYGAPTVIVVSHRAQDLQPGIEYANAACVAQTMHLAATDLGLGSVLAWGVFEAMRLYPQLDRSALLRLPEGFSPLLGLMVGYPVRPLEEREIKPDKLSVNYV